MILADRRRMNWKYLQNTQTLIKHKTKTIQIHLHQSTILKKTRNSLKHALTKAQ